MSTTAINQKDILVILKEVIMNHNDNLLGLEYYDIKLTSTLYDLGFDSLDVTEISMSLERTLNIRIEDEEVEHILMRKSVEEIMHFLYDRHQKTHNPQLITPDHEQLQ